MTSYDSFAALFARSHHQDPLTSDPALRPAPAKLAHPPVPPSPPCENVLESSTPLVGGLGLGSLAPALPRGPSPLAVPPLTATAPSLGAGLGLEGGHGQGHGRDFCSSMPSNLSLALDNIAWHNNRLFTNSFATPPPPPVPMMMMPNNLSSGMMGGGAGGRGDPMGGMSYSYMNNNSFSSSMPPMHIMGLDGSSSAEPWCPCDGSGLPRRPSLTAPPLHINAPGVQIVSSSSDEYMPSYEGYTARTSDANVRLGMLCACRECSARRDANGRRRSPYCSQRCQTREQNLRQGRVRPREELIRRKEELVRRLTQANDPEDELRRIERDQNGMSAATYTFMSAFGDQTY